MLTLAHSDTEYALFVLWVATLPLCLWRKVVPVCQPPYGVTVYGQLGVKRSLGICGTLSLLTGLVTSAVVYSHDSHGVAPDTPHR